jgi:hypothetical protein
VGILEYAFTSKSLCCFGEFGSFYKMGLGSAPVYELDSDDDEASTNQSVSELISTLRTAYRAKDVGRVEAILVVRETELKREIENAKKENTLVKGARECCVKEGEEGEGEV